MNNFETLLYKTVFSSVQSVIKRYLVEFINELSINIDNKLTVQQIVEMWDNFINNTILESNCVHKNKYKKDLCEYVYIKEKNINQQCKHKISSLSMTKKFCSKHYRQNEKNDIHICTFLTNNKECGKHIKKGSLFCSKHINKEIQEETNIQYDRPSNLNPTRIKDGHLNGLWYIEHNNVK